MIDCIIIIVGFVWLAFTVWLLIDLHVTKDELKCSEKCEHKWVQRWQDEREEVNRYAAACEISKKMYDKLLCEHAELQRTFDVSLDSFIIHKRSIQRIKSICDKLWEVADPKPETETEATNDPDLHPDC